MKTSTCLRQYKWWLHTIIYALLALTGQTIATLLGRSYFDNGGTSVWMAALVQVVGFPILLPFLRGTKAQTREIIDTTAEEHLTSFYFHIAIGIPLAADCMLYSIGLQYLPTTALVCASQLGFNFLFTYFLNKQNSTPYIVNSLGLLTISSVLLVFQVVPGNANKTCVFGCVCTLAASAGYALTVYLTQAALRETNKKETFRAVIDTTVHQNSVATFVLLLGLFASGDLRKLEREMREYGPGHVPYVMNLFLAAVCWQAFSVGCVGLVVKVSSLFSNVIGILGMPVGPALAVLILKEKMAGSKAVAMAMFVAVWGFVSYLYQHYLDDLKMKDRKNELTDNDIYND